MSIEHSGLRLLWRLSAGIGVVIWCTSVVAQDRVQDSIRIVTEGLNGVLRTIELQNACLDALSVGVEFVSICNDASHAHLQSVVLPDLGIYLDALIDDALIRQDIEGFELSNEYMFRVSEARALSERIILTATDAQQSAMLKASIKKTISAQQ